MINLLESNVHGFLNKLQPSDCVMADRGFLSLQMLEV